MPDIQRGREEERMGRVEGMGMGSRGRVEGTGKFLEDYDRGFNAESRRLKFEEGEVVNYGSLKSVQ